MKILAVDDNPHDRELLRCIIEAHGHEVVMAEDGQEGLDLAAVHKPHLIISDALMPVMDGFQFLRKVKQDANLRSIPFIFYSSVYGGHQDKQLAASLGADAYITKPTEPVEFWKEVGKTVSRKNAAKDFTDGLIEDDASYLKQYTQVVSVKLEEKVRELEKSLAERQQAEEALREMTRMYAMLSKTNQTIVYRPDLDRLFETTCEIAVDTGGFLMAWVGRVNHETATVEVVASKGVTGDYLDKINIVLDDPARSAGPTGRAIKSKTHVVCNDILHDDGMLLWREAAIKNGYGSLAAFPLIVFNEVWGALTLYNHEANFFSDDESLIDELVKNISFGIETHLNEQERKRAGEALRESEAKYRRIVDTSIEGIWMAGPDAITTFVNPRMAEMLGYQVEEMIGRPLTDFMFEEDVPRRHDKMEKRRQGRSENYERRYRHKNGQTVWALVSAVPLQDGGRNFNGSFAMITDITEKKKLEDQLRQSQKMEAIGTLAGGVAHDFNNILTAIIGYATLAKMDLQADDPVHAGIDQILSSSERAAHLTHSLLAFSRKQVINPKPVDLNNIVRNVEKLLRRLIREDIEFSTRLGASELIVMADAGQIDQVLMNFATNARDAMPEGGRLTITTQETELHEDFVNVQGYGRPGTYALLTVSDTGCGMDEGTREKIFEPFFTTKESGKGTGLGLAIVYGIVKQHGGHITVCSEPGKGTTFKIYQPLIASSADESKAQPAAPPRGGTETILLAEDDKEVRNLTRSVLTGFGYRVIEAMDGQDAIDTFRQHATGISLILLDVVMPKKNGRDVYDAAKAISPGVKAVFYSGYTADLIHQQGIIDEGLHFVLKPSSPVDLLRTIRAVLDERRDSQ